MTKATLILAFSLCAARAQTPEPDRLMSALQDRTMSDQIARMKTDDRLAMYQTLIGYKPDNLHYQNLMATAFIQKMRETSDSGYLDRAKKLVDQVLSAEGS